MDHGTCLGTCMEAAETASNALHELHVRPLPRRQTPRFPCFSTRKRAKNASSLRCPKRGPPPLARLKQGVQGCGSTGCHFLAIEFTVRKIEISMIYAGKREGGERGGRGEGHGLTRKDHGSTSDSVTEGQKRTRHTPQTLAA